MVRVCSECDTVLLPDVWTQHSHNAINKCLRCKRKGGFKKAVGLSRELRELASTTIEMRTITVLFPCELCEVKGKNLRYCVRHGHDERKVLVQEPDIAARGDETVNHKDYEKEHPDVHLIPAHDAPIFSLAHSGEEEAHNDG